MSGTDKSRVRRGESGWRELVKRWEGSGLSHKEFCEQEGASLTCFRNWQRRFSAGPGVGGFIELKRKSESWDMELDLGYGVVLRLRRQV